MSILNMNTKAVVFTFRETEGFDYIDLKNLYSKNGADATYKVNGLYINENGHYGKSPLVVGESQYINLPSHMVEQVEEIRDTEKLVQDINDGKVGFKIYQYEQKQYKRTCYSIEWIEYKEENPFK